MNIIIIDTVIKNRFVKNWFDEYGKTDTHLEKTQVTTVKLFWIPIMKICKPIDTNL